MHSQQKSLEGLAALGQEEGAVRAEEKADGADAPGEVMASSLAAE